MGSNRKKGAGEEAPYGIFRAEVVSNYPRKTIGSVANRVSTKSGEVHSSNLLPHAWSIDTPAGRGNSGPKLASRLTSLVLEGRFMGLRMWGKALRVIPRLSKEEWDDLDLVARWLIATRSAVLVMTFISAAIAGISFLDRR